MKKILIFIVAIFICTSLLSIQTPAQGVEDISVEVQPRRISTRASYKLNLKLEKPLQVHDWIKIIWPKGTTLPSLPENKSERTAELTRIVESIYIGTSPCSACQGLPVIDYRENSIRFNIHLELDPKNPGYEYVYIHVTDRVGIINPATPGMYELKIQTQSESGTFDSHSYEIVDSKIGDPTGKPTVEVEPNGINHQASYQVSFTTGRGGELFMNRSRIRVQFPPETTLLKKNQEIPLTSIRVNGKPLGQMPMILDTTVTILSPLYIGNSESVKVDFDKEAGLLNPSIPGSYKVLVSTSEDIDEVLSGQYDIIKQKPTLEVIPAVINKKAAYHFTFVADQDIIADYPIYVQFPASVKLPRYIDPSDTLVNHASASSVSVRNSLLMISSQQTIVAGNVIDILLKESAGIQNPPSPGPLVLEFKWFDQQQWEETLPIEIVNPTVKFTKLEMNPNNANEISTYTCTIQNGTEAIQKNESIQFLFSEGFQIPSNVDPEAITIGGIEVLETSPTKDSIGITLPREIVPEEVFTVVFHRSAMIKNPPAGDQWIHLYVSTPHTKEPKQSPTLYLYPPIPYASVQLLEGTKGKKNWYTSPPLLSFTANQKDLEIHFWFDDETDTQLYHKPMTLEVGQYTTILYYYAQNSYEKGPLQEELIKIDTIQPELTITQPIQPITYTSSTQFVMKGRILTQGLQTPQGSPYNMDIDSLEINKEKIEFHQDEETKQYYFSFSIPLDEGENHIVVAAYDEAGNVSEKEFQIIRDTIAPDILVSFPTADSPTFKKSFEVLGKTEPFTELYINNELIFVDREGNFAHPMRVDSVGKSTLQVEAIDKSGNRSERSIDIWAGITLQLTIGSQQTLSNDTSVPIDTTPFITNGRTMIPFRYIGESLQATIHFKKDPVTKKVTEVQYEKENTLIVLYIGNRIATVNGQEVELDAAPSIVNGRTMVPLRFVAEELGCTLQWDSDLQRITIEYPAW
jgi:hypothetical protein